MIVQTYLLAETTLNKNLKFLLRMLLLLSIVCIPLWHFGEFIALFGAFEAHAQATLYSPLLSIVVKNSLVPLMVIVSFFIRYSGENRYSFAELMFFLLLTMMLVVALLMTHDLNIWKIIVGLRWFLPFFLMVLMFPLIDDNLVRQLAYVSIAMMGANLMMQEWELNHMLSHWGNFFEIRLAARTPGFFPLPGSAAMFASFSVLFSFLVFKDKRTRWKITALGALSVFLTQSGSGFCVMLLIILTLASGSRWRVWLPASVPIALGLMVITMPYLRGWSYLLRSGGARMQILSDGLQFGTFGSEFAGWLFDANFGGATNGAKLMQYNYGINIESVVTPDSFVGQIMANLGGMSLLIYLILMCVATLTAYRRGSRTTVLWLLTVGMYSLTMTITEAFPMFLLIVVAMIYSTKRGDFRLRENAG